MLAPSKESSVGKKPELFWENWYCSHSALAVKVPKARKAKQKM